MNNALVYLIGLLDFWPGLKTKIATAAAFALAVVQAWNAAVPNVGLDPAVYVIHIPDIVNAIIIALLGVGTVNAQNRMKRQLAELRK